MSDFLSRSQLRRLIATRTRSCVSVYMPAHRAGVETLQDPIRLKNLLRRVRRGLTATGLRSTQVRKLLEPARALVSNHAFWQHQSDGLVLFLSENVFCHYRLPIRFQELVVVADRFHLKPTLPLFIGNDHFYLLALSRNRPRLYEATRYEMSEIAAESMPESLGQTTGSQPPESQLQYHTASAEGGGHGPAIYHGHGAGAEEKKTRLLQSLRQLDRGLRDLLQNDGPPLLVAAVDYLFPIYREANTYPNLLEETVRGNPDATPVADLHSQAWTIVEPHLKRAQRQALEQYKQIVGTGRVSNDLPAILRQTQRGRIATLFVAVGVQRWGTYDPATDGLEIHTEQRPGDEDLLNLAAILAYANGAAVYASPPDEMPDSEPIAAIYRY